MRILIFAVHFPYPEFNGYSFTIMETVRRLSAAGAEVTVLGMHKSGEAFDFTKMPEEVKSIADYISVEINPVITPVEKYVNFFFSSQSLEMEKYYSQGVEQELLKVLENNTFDIIQIEDIQLSKYLKIIYAKHGGQIVLRIHKLPSFELQAAISRSKGKIAVSMANEIRNRMKEQETRVLLFEDIDYILTLGEADKQYIQQLFQNAIKQKVEGINKATVKMLSLGWNISLSGEAPVREKGVIYTGSLQYPANLSAFSRFFQNIWLPVYKMYPDILLHVVSRVKPEGNMGNIGISEGVVWEGEIAGYYDFLRSKSIMVLPVYESDGWQKRLWEGMACGCALVVTPPAMDGVRIVHGEHALIAKGEAEFRRYLGTLIEHENIADTIGRHAGEYVSRLTSENKTSEEFTGFYQKLIL